MAEDRVVPGATSQESRSKRRWQAALALGGALAWPVAGAAPVPRPLVPAGIQAPSGYEPFLLSHARGTQNYVCLPSGAGFGWTFYGPDAILFNDSDRPVAVHYLGRNPAENDTPRATWQDSRDASAVWGLAVSSSSDEAFVRHGAIPWLLLQVVGAERSEAGWSTLPAARYIQRIHTEGGSAPAAGCSQASDVGKKALVPYEADYVFFKAER